MAQRVSVSIFAFTILCSVVGVDAGQTPESSPSPSVGAAASETPEAAKLRTVLDKRKEEWRPCNGIAVQQQDKALQALKAALEGRLEDSDRLTKEGKALQAQFGKQKCDGIKKNIGSEMKKTGAADADMDKAWAAFIESLKEPEKK